MIPDVSLSGLKAAEASDPKAVAAKVQSLFTEVMLKTMEESVDAEDGLFGGSASSDIYRGMLNEHLAAGADHVAIQVLGGWDKLLPTLTELAPALGLKAHG